MNRRAKPGRTATVDSIIDLHVHTREGSIDSDLPPEDLVEQIHRLRLVSVALLLGTRGTGGSDAHSVQGIARGSTLFHGEIRNERDLLEALRAGAYTPIEGYNKGRISPYGELPERLKVAYGLA